MLPSNLENNSTFLLSIKTTLSAALTLLPKEVTDIDISDTSEFEVQLSYIINISGCTAASNLIAKLRSIMDSGYFIETLRTYTGIAELNISEPLITVNATSGPPQRVSMTVSDPGASHMPRRLLLPVIPISLLLFTCSHHSSYLNVRYADWNQCRRCRCHHRKRAARLLDTCVLLLRRGVQAHGQRLIPNAGSGKRCENDFSLTAISSESHKTNTYTTDGRTVRTDGSH